MEIQVVGSGCRNCKNLLHNVEEAVKRLGLDAAVRYVTEPADIAATGILRTPGLIVDGMVRSTGRVPDVDEVAAILGAAAPRT